MDQDIFGNGGMYQLMPKLNIPMGNSQQQGSYSPQGYNPSQDFDIYLGMGSRQASNLGNGYSENPRGGVTNNETGASTMPFRVGSEGMFKQLGDLTGNPVFGQLRDQINSYQPQQGQDFSALGAPTFKGTDPNNPLIAYLSKAAANGMF